MARLPKGQAPTPRKERLQRYRAELEREGGRRVIIDLPEPGASALARIIERDSDAQAPRPMSIKDAITNALVHYAKLSKGRP